MKIKIKRLHPDAIIPTYGTEGASGFDLYAVEDVPLYPGQTNTIGTGLAFEVEPGYELQIRPRSGLSLKTALRVANSPGTVDSDYRGEVKIIMQNTKPFNYYTAEEDLIVIKKGERIAQGVICPVIKVEFDVTDELQETERGEGGFGSTGI